MKEKIEYLSDCELEHLISQVEQDELVAAPPDLMEHIWEAAGLVEESRQEPSMVTATTAPHRDMQTKKKEFYAYCFRVITSVAAAVALVFLLPEMTERIEGNQGAVHRQEAPSMEDVVETAPQKEQIISAKPAPTKEEVLNDSAFLDKVLEEVNWLGRNN